jgi:hypothetical protein
MVDAPQGAVFVWCNSRTHYPRELAIRLRRDDLQVVPLAWLHERNVRGCTFAGVVLDHAAHCSIEARMALDYLRYRGFLVESNTTDDQPQVRSITELG